MLIIVVVENGADRELADEVKEVIERQLPLAGYLPILVGVATEEDVRQEDIVSLLHWQARQGV